MRVVEKEEKIKRGCIYCLDYKTDKGYKKCKHNECPYHELEGHETYEDFFKSQAGLFDFLLEMEETDAYC